MPAYDAAATIEAAVDSVLAQDCDDWELVVTDDGSRDGTRAICDRYATAEPRISCESQLNAGTGAAISAAVARSRGEYIVQLGADDELLPEYCSTMVRFIDANPGFDIYASNACRLLPDGTRELYHTQPRFQGEFSLTVDDLLDEPLIYGTAAFRRGLFEEVGGFRSAFYNEDYDFWLRVMMAGAKHIYTPRPLALYRVTPGQKTEDGVRMRLEDIRILEDAVASGQLTPEQVEHATRSIALLKKNVGFRRWLASLIGSRLAEPVFQLAHKAAVIVRSYRRKR
jgi:glycosyltransferase involved in cell wall biosynthesis